MRVSVKSLFVLELLLATLLARVARDHCDPLRAVAAIEKLGGELHLSDGRYGRGLVADWRPGQSQVVGVRLRECQDADLQWLCALPELRWLDLRCTQISDAGLQHLARLRHLRSLLILDHTAVTSAGLEQLSGLTELEWLQLGDTHIDDAGLVHLSGMRKLATLELYSTRISDRGLVHLKKLPALDSLFVNDTRVTPAGVHNLMVAKPACHVTQ